MIDHASGGIFGKDGGVVPLAGPFLVGGAIERWGGRLKVETMV
jgi:hypothetical protein